MEATNIVVNQGAQAANNPSEVENKPASDFSFMNPIALAVQNERPPPIYKAYEQPAPRPGVYPLVIRTQPQPMPANMINALNQASNINDYMMWSALNCLCCCWPMGLVALILSIFVSQKKNSREVESAMCLSKSTAVWNGITTLLGIALNIFLIMYYIQKR